MSISEDGIVVAADQGAILVKRVRPAGGDKISALDFVGYAGLKVGDVLGQ